MRYLNPNADLTIRRVFGEHPDLMMSLLNALLPLSAEQEINEIEYLAPGIIPEHPLRKFSIIDVLCKDRQGRQFMVEIQTVWSQEFSHRVRFDSSKVYVQFIGRSKKYSLQQPLYSLNLSNYRFEPELEGFYHHYQLVHAENSGEVIDGLQLIFVELPKFSPHNFSEKKMQVLWLRYLTEIYNQAREVPQELLDNAEVKKAVTALEESTFTDAQLLGYEKFWDIISVEKTLYNSAERKGFEKGLAEGRAAKRVEIARNMKQLGAPAAVITQVTSLNEDEIARL